MSLKLYYDLLSQPSRVLYIFVKTCNIPFEKKIINLGKMEQHNPDYEKVNPFKKVPAIEHNGFNIIESVAILRYLCREFNVADHWYPKDSKAQIKVDEYLEWQHLNTRLHCGSYFHQKYLIPRITGEPITKDIMDYENRMIDCLNLLENVWLKNKPFLAGSDISIADLVGSCEVEQVRLAGYNPHEGRPHLTAWMNRVADKTNPYYQEAHVFIEKLSNMIKEDTPRSKI
ncbi:PREDICTED: glutathione S-transferase theta-1-like [Dufourea novaeangliae]|uniref:glutathione transferase n=1 Tax=Dufourea novaeangliae TaxID=178035 RepID=A0A154NYC5_DUFNO|nr:PREDICTED: glutathione S-transferase theta-1-like [Dufourea novaeangliae]KZC04623.1 Glutathione S-transferase theta-1 [Dufourea novaeangliae]